MSTTTDPTSPGEAASPSPTPVSRRALAPDLARGMMLLLIALAHVPWFLYTSDVGVTLLHPAGGSVADRVAQAFTIITVDARAYPLFALLFAYGIGQLYTRQIAGGTSAGDARRLLRTRHLWLLGFGLLHAALLWQGDILGTYGLMGLVLVPLFLNRSDRVLKIWIGVLLAAGAGYAGLMTALAGVTSAAGPAATAVQRLPIEQDSYLLSIPFRLLMWAPGLLAGFLTLTLPAAFLLGLLASRHRVLEEPARHLRLLRRTAIVGLTVGWGVGAVQAMVHLGAFAAPAPTGLSELHIYSGFFAGIGYAAVFALVAHRITARGTTPPLPVRALVALGRRSMSGYVAQSLVWALVLAASGLAVGAHLSSWSALLVGIGTWLLTVVVAHRMDRAGVRGPAETLLRRLTYRSARH
ncbi:DUF418 domain-containing protein [Pseudonocardia parietis]|uniref:Membrane protein YeiB n=1 Tax=Pseudonocardia parietis TaxID=570936 RepID=A0ABS4VN36_9PSEU|nr:DUF418 domain-containing protein [Pseudonocardia parietis]MBP2365307.1 putative membrane protein YeiB [Pseudonocardia parietis]